MQDKRIRAENLSFYYGEEGTNGIHRNTFDLYQSEVVLLAGNSGEGKSTLLKCLNGLIPNLIDGRLEGDLFLGDRSYREISMEDLSLRIASVFQNPRSQFFTNNSTAEIVFPLENYGWSKADMEKKLKEIVEDFFIGDLLDREISSLSSGERQLLALATSLSLDQSIILFDEPSANLDYGNAKFLARIIKGLKEVGMTVLVADHRFFYLEGLIDRVFLMEEGRMKIFNSQEEFIQSSYDTRSFHILEQNFPFLSQAKDKDMVAQCKGLWYSNILEDVSFNLYKGEVVALIGVNGAGKSTLANLLTKSVEPEQGTVEISQIPYLIIQDADYQLFGTSVEAEVKLSPYAIEDEEVESILRSLNLWEKRKDHPFDLSGGQKQRLQIATAIANKKNLIIFDEPTSGLDSNSMKRVVKQIERLKEDSSILIISHDYEFIRRIAHRILYMKDKKIKEDFLLEEETEEKLKDIYREMEEFYER